MAACALAGVAFAAPPRLDLDGNGKADLLWRNTVSGQTAVWLMNGTAASSSAVLMTDPNWVVTATGDFNGDGKTDLVWHNDVTGQTAIWLMSGTSVLASAFVMTDPNWVVTATGDFNGDGKTDLVWRNNDDGRTAIWLMNGTQAMSSAYIMSDDSWVVTATADFNGDGRTDLIWRNDSTGQTAMWLMNGTAVVGSAYLTNSGVWEVTATGDLNGDGMADLLWRNKVTGQTAVWLMAGTSATATAYVSGDSSWSVTAVADLNGDGKADLVWTNNVNGQVALSLMNGTTPTTTVVVNGDPAWYVAQVRDTNGDGRADLVWINAVTGASAVWLMNGTVATSGKVVLTDRSWTVNYDAGPSGYSDSARLLARATFGSARDEIVRANGLGPDGWLAEQFAKPHTSMKDYVYPLLISGLEQWDVNSPAIWRQLFQGDDQLRLRVMYALSQILVVSLQNNAVSDAECGSQSYLDTLANGAFGNYRDLLKNVALHPVMGEYLNMKGSAKADQVTGQIPNENFAREILQLFSIGTVMLNLDGSVATDTGGKSIATYDQTTIRNFAKAFSGWTYAGQDQTKSWVWLYPDIWDNDHVTRIQKACPAWSQPMAPWMTTYRSADDARDIPGPAHDTTAKTLLSYPGSVKTSLPAGQSPMQDLDDAIDNIFRHPNVGPFLAKRLIQRLVVSNPSPGYIRRVATVFNDNGSGVRGDLQAVVRQILRDPEAAGPQYMARAKWGKLREPVIRFTQTHRAFKAVVNNPGGFYDVWDLSDATNLGQDVLRAPSVFNFYTPSYAPSASFGADGSAAPEFQITTTDSVSGYADFSQWGIIGGFRSWNANDSPSYWIKPDYSYYTGIADNATRLVQELELVMAERTLDPEFRRALVASISKIDASDPAGRLERFKTAFWLLMNTPDGLVQR